MTPTPAPAGPTFQRIALRAAELGQGLTVRRALPTRHRRRVGAWCFLDHIGPINLQEGAGLHVGAHPHTGLQTFTWMVQGQILHRDSLGSEQVVRPGQVNLMTAGHGIAHTEDSLPEATVLHAAQLWIALPPAQADLDPAFDHYPDLPTWTQDHVACTLLAGHHAGHVAPTRVHTPLLGMELAAPVEATTTLSLDPAFEYGLLPLIGTVDIGPERVQGDEFAYLGQGRNSVQLTLAAGSRALLLGGAPFEPPIVMWWNFVGLSRPYIAQAVADWAAQAPRFGRVQGGEGRRIDAPPWP